MGQTLKRFLTLAALLVAWGLEAQGDANPMLRRRSLPARVGPDALKGHDMPDLRKAWDLYWFGGELSPAYLDYKNRKAAEEVQRWRPLFPKGQAGKAVLPTPPGVGGASWTNLGPTSNLTPAGWSSIDSGRPVAIVPHPTVATTLYLATSGGGIFKCTNADIAQAAAEWIWTPITDDLPASGSSGNVSIGAMAMSPADANVLYVGLGDPFDAEGRGFFKSTDGGANWTAATGLGNATRSYSILPLTASLVFWSTNDGLKVSNDGGVSFAAVTGGPATGLAWTVRKVTATDLICSIEGTPNAIYTSSNAGTAWTLATITGVPPAIGVGRITLAAAGDGTTAYGIVEDTATGNIARGVLKSTNKGVTWTWTAAPTVSGGLFQGTGPQMATDGGQGFYNHGLAVDPTNPLRLVVGANLALYRSMDGGSSWTQLSHWYGSGHPYVHADNHATAWSNGTLFVGNDGGLAILKDPWRATVPTATDDLTFIDNRRNKGIGSHLVYNVGSTAAATPADSKWRVSLGLQDNGTRVRQGSGAALQTSGAFEDQIGGDGFGTVIHPVNGDLMLGSIYYTRIYKSTDGGVTPFSPSSIGIAESGINTAAPFAPKIAFGPNTSPDTVYTFVNSKVYKSTDFGSNWSAMSMTGYDTARLLRNVNGSRSSNAVGAASSGGRFWTTYNDGATWTDSTDITGGTFNTSYIWFNTEDDQIVYGSTVAPNAAAHHLFKSANGGATWASIDGTAGTPNGLPFGVPVHVIQNLRGSKDTLFAGTDFGVYRSTDGGASWARYGNGLPLVAVRDLYIAPDGSFLRAATYGRGVWELVPPVVPGSVTISPTFAALYTGDIAQFTGTVNGGGTVTYTATGGTISAGGLYTAGNIAGTFKVTATNAADNTQKADADITITVPIPVTFSTQPANLSSAVGRKATFTVVASGSGTLTYQWKRNGVAVSTGTGGTTASYTTPTLTLSDSGSVFLCEVTGRAGMVASDPASLTVQSLGTAVTVSNSTVTAIPDAISAMVPGAVVEVPFSVSGVTGNVGEVQLALYLTHTWIGDLDVTLVAPDLSTVSLARLINLGDAGSASGAAFGTSCTAYATFADLGAASIQAQTSANLPLTGIYIPNQLLDRFNGKDPNGTWKLRFQDLGPIDTGNFRCGVLTIKPLVGPSLDLNGDGATDLRDLLFFAKNFGTVLASCDLNSDGAVDDADLTILLAGL